MKKIILLCVIIHLRTFAQSGYNIELKKIYCDWVDAKSFVDSVETIIRDNYGNIIPPSNDFYYEYHAITDNLVDPPIEDIFGDLGLNKTFEDNDYNYIQTWYVIVKDPTQQTILGTSNTVVFQMETNPANAKQIIFEALKSNGNTEPGVHAEHWMYVVNLWNPNFTRWLTVNHDEVLKSSPGFLSINNDKFNYWNLDEADVLNHNHFYYEESTTENLIANYKTSYGGAAIQYNFDGFAGDSIEFKDPWLVDYNDSPYGMRNQGMNAPFKKVTSPFNPSLGSAYKGVLLNQDPTFDPNLPNYSISIPSSIYLTHTGRTHNLYLQNWNVSGASLEHENALETGVVFTSISGANISANVKATQLSDKLNGFDNSSQRKFIKTGDGVMHHVYESMGKVWYEKSTNNGGDWILMNGGKPLSNYPSKNPSIAGVSNFRVLIVFQETTQVGFFIKVLNINFLNDQILDTEQIELLQESDADVDPIIEYSVAGSPDYVVIAWKENLEGGWGDGGYYIIAGKLHGGVMGLDDIILYETSKIQIPETDYNTQNMAISKNSFHTYDNSFYLTWEQVDPESGDHSINFDSLHVISQINDADFYFYPMQTVSSISGYENHYEPSLTIMNDNIARICWVGQRQIEETDEIQSNVIFAASDNPTFFRTFGYKVNSANINRADNGNAYVIGWSEEEGEINRIVDNYLSGSHIRDLNMTGKNIQICNGSTLSNMYATAFNAGSLLYYFLQSNNIQSYYINPTKVSTTSISEGREGIVAKNKLQFYFGVGDVKVDNELVSFKEIADSIRFSNLQTLNQYLTTEPFPLTDNSSFYYSVQFGVTDTSYAQNSLSANSFVKFRVLLLDDNTNQPLGVYDEVTYTLANLLQHKNIAYQVNTNGVGNRTVRLALEVTENIEPKYALAEKYADDYVITKEKYETISFQGKLGVTEYALEQNYPNPFNPVTTIRYQIPKAGRVTLKVYDILGKEIAKLVNEEKETGRYTVNFDASALSSGVYLYEIVVNDYRAVKKLITIK